MRLSGRFVAHSRPKEALEAILETSGDEVKMEMCHRLTNYVVVGHEQTVRGRGIAHSPANHLDIGKIRAEGLFRQIEEGTGVISGNNQRMSKKYRGTIEKGHACGAGKDKVLLPDVLRNLAESA